MDFAEAAASLPPSLLFPGWLFPLRPSSSPTPSPTRAPPAERGSIRRRRRCRLWNRIAEYHGGDIARTEKQAGRKGCNSLRSRCGISCKGTAREETSSATSPREKGQSVERFSPALKRRRFCTTPMSWNLTQGANGIDEREMSQVPEAATALQKQSRIAFPDEDRRPPR